MIFFRPVFRLAYAAIALGFVLTAATPLQARTISWAGRNWIVKNGAGLGPGPNNWSDSTNNVWVDTNGWLHLSITKPTSTWYCAEITSEASLSYGEYRFQTATAYDRFCTNVVGGLFTYLDDTNEIDIEFTRAWTGTNNANFATQPARAGNYLYYYTKFTEGSYSTHRFIWETNRIYFQSYFGHADPPPASSLNIADWTYTGSNIPPDSTEKLHLNMWLYKGRAPTATQYLELVVHNFVFIPSYVPTQHLADIFYDDFNDANYADKWSANNDPDLSVQTNGSLRIKTDNYGDDQSGLVTLDRLSWPGSSGCVFQANLKTIDVTRTNALDATDVKTVLAAVSDGRYRGTLYFATNAVALLGSYISASNEYQLRFLSKMNTWTNLGTERYAGVITNVRGYLAQGPVTIGFLLDSNRFQVFARDYQGADIPLQGGSSNGIGYHHMAASFTSAWWAVGVLNWTSGIAYAYYDETDIYAADPVSDDIDQDGLSDRWEFDYRGNLADLFTGGDYDQDGFDDRSEYRAGTEPTNRHSALQFANPITAPSGYVIAWQSATNKTYTLDRSSQLMDSSGFSGLATQAATPPLNVYTDITAAGSEPFIYRVRLE